jgi:hypothetical protein
MNLIKAIFILKISTLIIVLYSLSSCSKGGEPSPMASSNTSSVSTSDLSLTSKAVGVVGGDDKEDDDDNRGVPRKQK